MLKESLKSDSSWKRAAGCLASDSERHDKEKEKETERDKDNDKHTAPFAEMRIDELAVYRATAVTQVMSSHKRENRSHDHMMIIETTVKVTFCQLGKIVQRQVQRGAEKFEVLVRFSLEMWNPRGLYKWSSMGLS